VLLAEAVIQQQVVTLQLLAGNQTQQTHQLLL
jgi:hypothetical protein